jgi:hypothetical protein
MWHHSTARVAACDPDAFYPLRSLVAGPFHDLDDLAAIERLVRTVVLHDEIVMEITPLWYTEENDPEFTDDEIQAGGRTVITGFGPVLTGYDFFTDYTGHARPVPDVELSPALLEAAARHANAGVGNVFFEAAVEHLKRLLGIVRGGGSLLLCDEFGQQVLTAATRYPESLFQHLDQDWRLFALEVERDGLDLLVPPVLGIILTRCARRDAIPGVIRDLRDEWRGARKSVWNLLDALRASHTLSEALEIQRELSEASRLFSPNSTEVDTRPIRVLWEVLAAAAAGGATGLLSGGSPSIGAATNVVGQLARALPGYAHEFGSAIFGRGAFDLARRVRRESAQVELGALDRLLTSAETPRLRGT